jgi:hypothetical protein
MHNDGKSLKPILKESYGGKMKKKCKSKPFSKLLDKYGKKGKKYEKGGLADKVKNFFTGEGAKKTIRGTTGQSETFTRPSEEKTKQQKILEEAAKKRKKWGTID